jgi:hypothetical protein
VTRKKARHWLCFNKDCPDCQWFWSGRKRMKLTDFQGLYLVASTSGGTWYLVNLNNRTCTCPAGVHNQVCRHLVAAEEFKRGLWPK